MKREVQAETLILQCATHGETKWKLHIACDNCERVYQCRDDAAPNYAPERCACGSRLMPNEHRPTDRYSAAPICAECYAEKGKQP